MILFPALNEAFRIISEGIAFGTSDLDVASVKGMGFPAYRGGIIFWSNSLGFTYIYSRLDKWSKDYGDFFKPCAYLLERASDGTLLDQVAQTKSQL
ncbi:peroxisomal fatty acid beta-oxidation multifunctional protein MFP2-like [Olea europaea var. sylvestris]|nr:peroxisomal fatty acid beta-oxidation multifunctional protein MFP2-like [Olea europaea var. sylvestris]